MATMRIAALALLGISLMLAEIPAAFAQDADDSDDDANEIANKVTDEEASVPEPPSSQQPQGPVAPAAPQAEQPAAVAPSGELKLPGTVSIPTALNRFGKNENAAQPQAEVAAALPVKLAASQTLKSFGAEEKAKPTMQAKAAADAQNAHIAADVAKHAAKVAGKVATHSLHVTQHAKSALKDAQDALYKARVGAVHLSAKQKHSLEDAETKLRLATQNSDAKKDTASTVTKDTKKHEKMAKKMQKIIKTEKKIEKKSGQTKKKDSELEAMRQEIKDLRADLKDKEGDKAEDDAMLKELQDSIEEMEEAAKKDGKSDKKTHDEMKAEIERLRAEIKSMENKAPEEAPKPLAPEPLAAVPAEAPLEEEEKSEKYRLKMKPLKPSEEEEDDESEKESHAQHEVTPVEQKGIDIDTAMPYGDLEPFGREDTAQELTENSIQESNSMVDQLERAEVAEEKRSVFRALTRLRGAAITSFDGVARSQTGNIDEYNKIHKWRGTHPLHHLADEESDVSKWAFPDNAD